MVRSFWTVLLSLVAISAGAVGQDVRLSPEPTSYLLATELRIQSAASIGSTTLAVWGTSVANQQSGGVKGTLRFQVIRDTTPMGAQGTLPTAEAEPYGVVRVFDLADRFLVVWNDRRAGAEGMYAQIVDTAGSLLAGEIQLSRGAMQADSLAWRVRSASGWVLVWQDSASGGSLKEIKMDAAGNPTSAPTMIGGGAYRRGVQFAGVPGLLLLQDKGQTAVAFWSDKGVDARPIPAGHFAGSYHLSRDSSLLVLKDSTLTFYDSFFDSVPAKSLSVQFGPGLLPGTQAVMKDDTGGISIIYMRERVGLMDVFYISHIYRQWVVGDTLGKRDTLAVLQYLDYLNPGGFAGYRTKFNWATIDKGFSNTTRITVKFWEEEIYSYLPYDRVPRYSTFAVASNGAFIGFYQDSPVPLSLRRLGITGSPVERRLFDTTSSITVVASGTEQTVATTVAEQVINIPQLRPNVMEREGALLVNYDQSEKKAIYPLGVWINGATPALQMLPSLSIETYDKYVPTENDQSHTRLLNGMDHTVLLHDLYYRKETSQHGHPTTITYQGWHRYYLATDSGWRMMAQFYQVAGEMKGISSSRLSFYGLEFQFDPEQKLLYGSEILQIGEQFLPIDSNRFVYAANAHGAIQTMVVDAPQVYHGFNDSVKAIIPITGKEFLAIYPASLLHLKDTVVVGQASFHPVSQKVAAVKYLALRNKRYLRCFATEAAPTILQLETFSHGGKLLDSTSLQLNVPLSRVAIVQNPTDRSLALLYGGAGGAKLTLLSERLRVQQDVDAGNLPLQDYPISETRDTVGFVSGIFRNDTLFAVWEDSRNGVPDIYGTGWGIPAGLVAPIIQPPAAAIAEHQPISITAIAPLPCDAELSIQHHLPERGAVTITIMDAMGKSVRNVVQQLPSGVSESHLMVDDLFPGLYMLRLSNAHGSSSKPFVVMR